MMAGMPPRRAARHERYSGLSLVRAVNEDRVLEAVLAHGPISRSDLGRLLGISKPTVSSIMTGLEDAGLVRTVGSQASGVGRPATLYTLNRQAGYVLGIDLGGTPLRAILADLYGDVVEYVSTPLDARTPKSILAQLADVKRQLLDATAIEPDLLQAATVGVPGILDPELRRTRAAYNVPALSELDLQRDIAEALGVPVHIENDVNLSALGEGWRGGAVGFANFVVIAVDTGVGMGIVIDGELYRGPSGAAGEIDFLPLAADGVPEASGHGPLEGAISAPAVLHRHERAGGHAASVQEIVAAAQTGDPIAARTIEEIVSALAHAIASVVCVLDPQRVILAGGVGALDELLEPVRVAVDRRVPSPVAIETSPLADRGVAYGALAVALRQARQGLLEASSYAPEPPSGPRNRSTRPWSSLA